MKHLLILIVALLVFINYACKTNECKRIVVTKNKVESLDIGNGKNLYLKKVTKDKTTPPSEFEMSLMEVLDPIEVDSITSFKYNCHTYVCLKNSISCINEEDWVDGASMRGTIPMKVVLSEFFTEIKKIEIFDDTTKNEFFNLLSNPQVAGLKKDDTFCFFDGGGQAVHSGIVDSIGESSIITWSKTGPKSIIKADLFNLFVFYNFISKIANTKITSIIFYRKKE